MGIYTSDTSIRGSAGAVGSASTDGQTRRSRFQKAYSTDVNAQRFQQGRYTQQQQQKRHHWSRGVATSSSSVAATKTQNRRKLTFDVEKCESQDDVSGESRVATITRNKTMTLSEPSTEEEKSRLLHRPDDIAVPGCTSSATDATATAVHRQPQQQEIQRLKASKPILVNNKSEKFHKSLLMTSAVGKAMTPSMTSSQALSSGSQQDSWRLMRQDFLPGKDQPEPFSVLVEKANDWLKKQPEVRVKSCETITCMFSDRYWPTNFECMLQSKRILPNVTNHSVRGLRLWLVPRGTTNQLQALQVTDILPSSAEDDVVSLVQRINSKIADNTLRGQILTIETISVARTANQSAAVDSDATYWPESSSESSCFVYAIRVFANTESNGRICGSEKVFVGVQDMIPMMKRFTTAIPSPADVGSTKVEGPSVRRSDVTDDNDDFSESYEGFEDLIERANVWMTEMWMRDGENFLVLNLQSLVVQKCLDKRPGTDCHYSMPALDSGQQLDMLRILRIYFLTPLGNLLVDLPLQTPLNFHTISPEVKDTSKTGHRKGHQDGVKSSRTKKKLESMTELVKRTNEFLLVQGCSEEILNAETVVNLVFDPVYLSGHADRNDDVKFLLTIRLYTIARREANKKITSLTTSTGGSVDNDCNSGKTPIGSSKTAGCSFENEESHPGPIFLGHVVNRSYKYRWLVAGATVIFCMTVVVIVSVAYSNIR